MPVCIQLDLVGLQNPSDILPLNYMQIYINPRLSLQKQENHPLVLLSQYQTIY